MTNPNNPAPQYLRYVDADVPASQAANARPVAIIDLPTGDGVSQDAFDALVARVEALENATPAG